MREVSFPVIEKKAKASAGTDRRLNAGWEG